MTKDKRRGLADAMQIVSGPKAPALAATVQAAASGPPDTAAEEPQTTRRRGGGRQGLLIYVSPRTHQALEGHVRRRHRAADGTARRLGATDRAPVCATGAQQRRVPPRQQAPGQKTGRRADAVRVRAASRAAGTERAIRHGADGGRLGRTSHGPGIRNTGRRRDGRRQGAALSANGGRRTAAAGTGPGVRLEGHAHGAAGEGAAHGRAAAPEPDRRHPEAAGRRVPELREDHRQAAAHRLPHQPRAADPELGREAVQLLDLRLRHAEPQQLRAGLPVRMPERVVRATAEDYSGGRLPPTGFGASCGRAETIRCTASSRTLPSGGTPSSVSTLPATRRLRPRAPGWESPAAGGRRAAPRRRQASPRPPARTTPERPTGPPTRARGNAPPGARRAPTRGLPPPARNARTPPPRRARARARSEPEATGRPRPGPPATRSDGPARRGGRTSCGTKATAAPPGRTPVRRVLTECCRRTRVYGSWGILLVLRQDARRMYFAGAPFLGVVRTPKP